VWPRGRDGEDGRREVRVWRVRGGEAMNWSWLAIAGLAFVVVVLAVAVVGEGA
jgi:hypothetical protein